MREPTFEEKQAFFKRFQRNLQRLGQTVSEGGLTGAVGKQNPWADDLAAATKDQLMRQLNRTHDVSKMAPAQLDEALGAMMKNQEAVHIDKMLPAESRRGLVDQFKAVNPLAKKPTAGTSAEEAARMQLGKRYDLSKVDDKQVEDAVSELVRRQQPVASDEFQRGAISRGLRQAGGLLRDYANPLSLTFGSRQSRLQALHDFHKGGLVGPGSILSKSMDFKDFGKTVGGTAKPFLAGGLAWPVGSIAYRMANPEEHAESRPRGIAEDVGWYIGGTTGLPFGAAGMTAGAEVGRRLGGYAGSLIDETLGTKKT